MAREAKILNAFDRPALPHFYDYAPEAERPYIGMAHAPGRPASRQVLAVVHARGVLHRDINTGNVLIDERGAVTLLDFGCSELVEISTTCPRASDGT